MWCRSRWSGISKATASSLKNRLDVKESDVARDSMAFWSCCAREEWMETWTFSRGVAVLVEGIMTPLCEGSRYSESRPLSATAQRVGTSGYDGAGYRSLETAIPSLLEPRRRSEKALLAVIRGVCGGRVHQESRRSGEGAGMRRHLKEPGIADMPRVGRSGGEEPALGQYLSGDAEREGPG